MPDRGVHTKASIVKRAISEYNARGPNIKGTTYKAMTRTDYGMPNLSDVTRHLPGPF
jgi:hypothetical protein